MSIHQHHPKDDTNSDSITENNAEGEADGSGTDNSGAELASETAEPKPINLQKRDYDLDPVRYGDWELNGRCIDF